MKILFWLYVLTVVPAMIVGEIAKPSDKADLHMWVALALQIVSSFGFYAMAYGKRLGTRLFWEILLAANLVDVGYMIWWLANTLPGIVAQNPKLAEMSVGMAIVIWSLVAVIALPIFVWVVLLPVIAVGLYVFRRPSIWQATA